MPVNRIYEKALRNLVKESIDEEALCVVKFYSNGCEYCHHLHEYYVDISDEYEDKNNIHFFAFNVEDAEDLDKIIKINGVPTIASIKTGLVKSKVRILEDPVPPNNKTWYFSKDIKNFVEREK